MARRSPDLGLPFIVANQAQQEITHNEALVMLQALIMGAIDYGYTPPSSPSVGDTYLLEATPDPSSDWAGKGNKVAIYYGSIWRFIPDINDAGTDIPMGLRHEGMQIYVRGSTNALMRWNGSAWVTA